MCYVIQFIIQLTTFAVNYQGHPFNSSITETKGFFNLLKWSYVFIAIVIYDLFGLGKAFSLVSSSLQAFLGLACPPRFLTLGRAFLVVTGVILTCLGLLWDGHGLGGDIPSLCRIDCMTGRALCLATRVTFELWPLSSGQPV